MYTNLCFCWFHNNILLEWRLLCKGEKFNKVMKNSVFQKNGIHRIWWCDIYKWFQFNLDHWWGHIQFELLHVGWHFSTKFGPIFKQYNEAMNEWSTNRVTLTFTTPKVVSLKRGITLQRMKEVILIKLHKKPEESVTTMHFRYLTRLGGW